MPTKNPNTAHYFQTSTSSLVKRNLFRVERQKLRYSVLGHAAGVPGVGRTNKGHFILIENQFQKKVKEGALWSLLTCNLLQKNQNIWRRKVS